MRQVLLMSLEIMGSWRRRRQFAREIGRVALTDGDAFRSRCF
jgi:hypothetical protein